MAQNSFKAALRILIGLTALSAFAAPWASASRLDLVTFAPEFVHERFGPNEGLPRASFFEVTQTSDGFLWIGTSEGLARFDGAGFKTFNATFFPALGANRITGLRAAADGVLWITTDGGRLSRRLRDGSFESCDRVLGDSISCGGRSVSSTEFLEPVAESAMAVDSGGKIWKISDHELSREGGGPQMALTAPPDRLSSLWIDASDTLWVTTEGGELHALYRTRVELLAEGLASLELHAVFEDQDGTIWVGGRTLSALPPSRTDRIESAMFRNFGCPERRTSCDIRAIRRDRAGTLWIGTDAGLFRFDEGTFAGPVGPSELAVRIQALTLDANGTMWAGTQDGLFCLEATLAARWRRVLLREGDEPSISTILQTNDDGLWIGTRGSGLIHWVAGRATFLDRSSGFPDPTIHAMWAAPEGYLWIGTATTGLVRLHPRDVEEAVGLDAPRLDWAQVGAAQGSPAYDVHHILDDGRGHLWISSASGIYRGRYVDFQKAADSSQSAKSASQRVAVEVPLIRYNKRDGLPDLGVQGASQQTGWRDREGRLIFASASGLVRFDPDRLDPDRLDSDRQSPGPPPPVFLDDMNIDDALPIRPPHVLTELTPDKRRVFFRFTAPLLRDADELRFRVRLVPHDEDWVDMGSRRRAFYSDLSPGHYRFEVSVARGGSWQKTTASREFRVTPNFHETRTFYLTGALLVLTLVAVAKHLRQRNLRRRTELLERTVEQRTRMIAAQAEKLKELDRVKSDLFANVSHEFRTPLALIIGSLQDQKRLDAQDSDLLEVALSNAARALGLVDQLLDVAKLDSGTLVLNPKRGDVTEILQRALERATPLAERGRIQLVSRQLCDPMEASFDEVQLEKVFDNLLGNAIKFVPEGGTVEVTAVTPSPESYEIAVKDDGPGIPAAHLDHIFDRFYQVGSEEFGAASGAGLGLALAKQIVELHGGTLDVESVEGEGACFIARLPREVAAMTLPNAAPTALAEGASARTPRPAAISGNGPTPPLLRSDAPLEGANSDRGGHGEQDPRVSQQASIFGDRATILVAEDNRDMRAYLRRHLDDRYRVVEAVDGSQALELARVAPPDVVVSDIMMPGLDGRALFRSLRQDPELELVPVILVTAIASPDSRLQGLREGVDDYLVKPFDPQELRARIQNILSSRRRLLDRVSTPSPGVVVTEVEVAPADQQFLDRVQQVIEERIDDADFTVEQLAASVGCDRSHLLRRLRSLIDQTPSGLLRSLRLQRAEQLLRARAGRVSEIAYSVGFKSLSHFSNAFNEEYGERPSTYTGRCREGRTVTLQTPISSRGGSVSGSVLKSTARLFKG